MTKLDTQQIKDIANGAAFLGSGGGGTLSSALTMVEESFPTGASVDLLTVDEAASDTVGLTAAASYMGSQTRGKDVTNVNAVGFAIRRLSAIMEERAGKPIKRLVPVELGVQSSVVPCLLAAQKLGLSVVDGDGAGRAVMGAMITTYAAAGLDPNPGVAANSAGSCAIIEPSPDDVDEGYRDPALIFNEMVDGLTLSHAFGVAGVCVWPMDGDQLKQGVPIIGTIDLASRVGQAMRIETAPVDAVLKILKDHGLWARVIYSGKVESVTSSARDYSTVTVAGEDGVKATVKTAGESVIASVSDRDQPIGMGPDSLCWMTPDGQAFSNTEIPATGTEVVLIGIGARRPLLESKRIMDYFHYFQKKVGYDGDYVEIQKLQS